MTNTPHGQVPEALRLAEEITNMICSSETAAKTIAAAADELCRQHARISELEAQIEALSGAQALSAAPAEVLGWLYEDELHEHYPYDAMFPHSKVDTVRMFPVFGPQAASPTPPALSAAPAEADSVLEDAARWQELREQHESDEALCCVFAPNDMRECLVPVGSLPGELDAFMDSERAARKQGANHD